MAWVSVENDGGLMVEGDYEVVCIKANQGETMRGTPVIDFEFQVRADVDQKYKNKHVFKSFFQDKDTGEWPKDRIGKYANSLGIPKGESFELYQLVGRCCIVHMRPYKGSDGVTRDSVVWSATSKAGQIGEAPQAQETQDNGFTQVDDDELPF